MLAVSFSSGKVNIRHFLLSSLLNPVQAASGLIGASRHKRCNLWMPSVVGMSVCRFSTGNEKTCGGGINLAVVRVASVFLKRLCRGF